MLAVKSITSGRHYFNNFRENQLTKFRAVYKAKTIQTIRSHSGDQTCRGQSPPETESIWPQSSDNPKQGKQTVTTAIPKNEGNTINNAMSC